MAKEEEKPKVQYRIPDEQAVPVVILSTIFDLISLAPLANVISAFVGQPIMFIIFTFMLGVPLFGKKTWLWNAATWVIEVIPFLSILPMFTIMTLRVIAISRAEDKLKSMGLDPNGEQAKGAARAFLQNKNVQLHAKTMERNAARTEARNKDGSLDKQKYADKRARIADRRADLDKSLAPSSKGRNLKGGDVNAGVNPPAQGANDDVASEPQAEQSEAA